MALVGIALVALVPGRAVAQDDPRMADILVVWTDRAASGAGGEPQVRAAIQNAILYTNLARANSLVDQKLRLVHLQRVDYDETASSGIDVDLTRLTSADAVIDEVLALRQTYGADLVAMVVQRTPMTCGAGEQLAFAPPERRGFSVVDINCLPFALAHETGHNAGAGHEAGAPGLPGMYDYSHAWVANLAGQSDRCGTVVASPSGQQTMPYYSSPEVRFGFGREPFLLGKAPEPEIVTPTPGTLLSGSTVTFTWNARGFPVMDWWLALGSEPGAADIYDSGSLGAASSHTVTADFPDDGSAVFARLYFTHPNGTVRFTEAVYNLNVTWKVVPGIGTALVRINLLTMAESVVVPLPGGGISIQHTGEADYRRLYYVLMMATVPPAGSGIYVVNFVTGDTRIIRYGNGEPMWVRSFRDGMHAVVVEVGAQNTNAEVFVFDQATGNQQTVTTVANAGSVRQFGNFVQQTASEWLLWFVSSVGTTDITHQVPLESGGPCFGLSTGAALADNARTLRETASIVANLQPQVVPVTYTLTIVTTGTGSGAVVGGGVYPAGAIVSLAATPDAGSAFAGFGGHPDCRDGVVVMTGDRACEVRFDLVPPDSSYQLVVSRAGSGSGQITSSPSGILCGSDCLESYMSGLGVLLTATPGAGSSFLGWSGDADCADGHVVMTTRRTCIASFGAQTRLLTITRAGAGTGTITSAPGGISCGTDCSQAYGVGTVVTLTAAADSLSRFDGWTGAADCADGIVTLTANVTCTANFLRLYRLTISKAGNGSGLVTSDIAGIHCGSDCTEQYPPGTIVQLSTIPAIGSQQSGWSGVTDCTDGTVTIVGDITCIVAFTVPSSPHRVLVDASRSDAIWWSPQSPPYNPTLPHAGRAIVDALSARGVSVTERASPPTCQEIGQSHLVVVSERTAWTQRDIDTYIRYLNAGGRMVLLEDVFERSDFALALGLGFDGWTVNMFPLQLTPHPITSGATLTLLGGKLLTAWPPTTEILGSLNPALPAIGLLRVGAGLVFFSGDTDGLYPLPQPFFDNMFGYMLANASPVSACGAPFTDDPIVPGSTIIRTVHITELRQRVDAARVARGLTPFAWTDVPLGPIVRAQHIIDLRTALSQAYLAAGLAAPVFSDPGLGAGGIIRAVHINELRAAVEGIQ